MSNQWKVLLILMFFLIVAQAWKIYELENRPCIAKKVSYEREDKKSGAVADDRRNPVRGNSRSGKAPEKN